MTDNVIGINGKPHTDDTKEEDTVQRTYDEVTDCFHCDICGCQELLVTTELELFCHECTHFIARIETVFTLTK